jgi:signal transduction histidine kinase
MKVKLSLALLLLPLVAAAATVMAAETATKEECVAKVKAAAALAAKEGDAAIVAKVNDPKGEFVWKDTYVFVLDAETATVVAHPANPKLIGKMLTGMKDVNGKMFFVEFIQTAKEKGEGWVDYMWPKPNETAPAPKTTYVYKTPGKNLVFAAGVYK